MSKRLGIPIFIVAHGGCGVPKRLESGPQQAAERALQVLKRKHSVLEAAVAGAVVLEDDPRFNAGTGSVLRLDGKTIEMDASVMDSRGAFGAVAGIQRVKNPVKVARALIDFPLTFLCGLAATQFARWLGFPDYDPETPRARKRFNLIQRRLKANKLPTWVKKWWKSGGFRKFILCRTYTWQADTIGIVVTDGQGNFAAAASTGGTSYSLPGRIGDTPLIGCGIFVGEKGAVTATGIGEEITRTMLSRRVYEKIEQGISPQKACDWSVRLFPSYVPIGLIAVSRDAYGIAANKEMAVGIISKSKRYG